MNENDLFRAFDCVDDDILERSEAPAPRQGAFVFTKWWKTRKWRAVAAGMVLAIGLVCGIFVAEAKEYSAAVEFFEENGLSTEGLSRSDVKEVYRDITTKKFTYSKTAKVIGQVVPGYAITQREPTSEELALLWDQNMWRSASKGAGIHYYVDQQIISDRMPGCSLWDKDVLECYRDGNLLWMLEFPDYSVKGSVHTTAGTAVWGNDSTVVHSWVARVDEDGKLLWKHKLDHDFQDESIVTVLENGDGTWTVVSRGDLEYLCLGKYDMDGNEQSFHKTELGNVGIWNAARLGDGYLVRLWSMGEGERLVRLDEEGNIVDGFTYEQEDCNYTITDMAEWNGRVCLSAYAVPKQTCQDGREIAGIVEDVFGREDWDKISSEELTPLVRGNYTAVLLLCDPAGDTLETFYSVEGSMGGKLAVDGTGELVWDVESVTSTFFSPATSSFTIGGTCHVFRYTFDVSGVLQSQEDTGEIVQYAR